MNQAGKRAKCHAGESRLERRVKPHFSDRRHGTQGPKTFSLQALAPVDEVAGSVDVPYRPVRLIVDCLLNFGPVADFIGFTLVSLRI